MEAERREVCHHATHHLLTILHPIATERVRAIRTDSHTTDHPLQVSLWHEQPLLTLHNRHQTVIVARNTA